MTTLALLTWLALRAEPPETWTVQSGDTCANIALRAYGDAAAYERLHQLNPMGPPPHSLRPGQVLRLRAVTSGPPSPEASLTFVRPAVRARHLADWAQALLGMPLFRFDEVNTLKGAGAEITFDDRSTLELDESALVVIYGAPDAGSKAPGGVALADGELRLSLAAQRQRAFAVRTRGAETALASGPAAAVTSVDGSLTSRLSLFEGKATVVAEGLAVQVPPGHGTRVLLGRGPDEPAPLPARPSLAAPTIGVLWAAGGAQAPVAWAAAERATSYRVQLARDEKFIDRVFDARTSALSVVVGGLEPGRYRARVIAFDAKGLQSAPSAPSVVEVVRVEAPFDRGVFWASRGQAPTVAVSPGLEVRVDGAPPTPLAPGRHQLEVSTAGQVLVVATVLTPPAAPALARAGQVVTFTFDDEVPEPAQLALRCDDVALSLTSLDARRLSATGPRGHCVLGWAGRALLSFEAVP